MTPLRVLLLAAALVAAGCGGSGTSEPVRTNEVAMAKSYRFEPQVVAVDAGDTVTWTNEDNFTHTVQVDGQADRRVERGESVSIAFPEPGTYHYVCTLHRRDMDGEVIVR
ncbi:MAG TPA: plastocyanin/azurin family copper-binding protein [Gaiellaceae bacterium]|nr:plastocyanin/azurin family copper-binding protein [Gaiellaceae bacterium]